MAIEDKYADIGFKNAAANALKPAPVVTNVNTNGAFTQLPVKNISSNIIDTTNLKDIGFDLAAKNAKAAEDKLKPPVTTTGKFRSTDGREFDTAAERDAWQAQLDKAAKDKLAKEQQVSKDDRDAFAQLKAIFESYGLGDLAGTIEKLMTEGYAASQALMMLKYDPKYNQAYTARFKGNADRISKGLNALTEAEYISNENAYAETLRAYGLNNMLSTDRKVNQAKFADYISNDVSSTEFKDRISTAVDNVVNADPAVMDEFKRYYGGLTTSDIVSYFLSPKETLPILKQKATAAGISAESVKQGLGSDAESRAMEFAKLGITTDQARVGYGNIGDVLPASQKLSSIYKEAGINYDKTAGENEFLLNNADAQRKRKQLASLERGKFSGDSGVSTQGGLSLGKSTQGKY
jgi:hypothetical protein